jgi:hypothetical protein
MTISFSRILLNRVSNLVGWAVGYSVLFMGVWRSCKSIMKFHSPAVKESYLPTIIQILVGITSLDGRFSRLGCWTRIA